MRRSREAKAESRDRIVAEARQAVLDRGIEAAGVAEIMQAAGLTHGGFYKHFATKEELVREAVAAAFGVQVARFDDRAAKAGAGAAAAAYRADYLSDEHVARPGMGCPVAALGAEAARQGAAMQAVFGDGAGALVDRLASAYGDAPDARKAAIRDMAQLVGAVVVARALGPGLLRDEVLAAVRGG
jgi:TetR/AcrR family transcriptional repressor of nem operon